MFLMLYFLSDVIQTHLSLCDPSAKSIFSHFCNIIFVLGWTFTILPKLLCHSLLKENSICDIWEEQWHSHISKPLLKKDVGWRFSDYFLLCAVVTKAASSQTRTQLSQKSLVSEHFKSSSAPLLRVMALEGEMV